VTAIFREWLAERLLGTKYATIGLDDEDVDRVAKQIGVDPDLLLEVRACARIERHSLGLKSAAGPKERLLAVRQRVAQINIFMPPPVHEAWKSECDFRGVDSTLLIRSMLHEYLLGAREPPPLVAWAWRGQVYRMGDRAKRMLHVERTAVPHGARRALSRRAERSGVPKIAIIRALMVEALEGDHRGVALVESSMMFDDETRYFQPPPLLP
jgi:hypothetical protein